MQYDPEVKYSDISPQDFEKVDKYLEPFKKGYLKPLESHLLTADNVRKYINSPAVVPEVRADFRLRQKEVEDALSVVIREYSQLEMELQPRTLEPEAEREYYNYFMDSEFDQNKLEFMKLVKTYEKLKTFNQKVRESWDIALSVFQPIKSNQMNRSFLEQVLQYRIYPRIELCELTDLFLRRMAYLLKIRKETIKNDKVSVEGDYTSVIQYGFSAIYRSDLADLIQETTQVPDSRAEAMKKVIAEQLALQKDTCIKGTFLLDSRGTEVFNQSYLYMLEIAEDKILIEEAKIRKAVYIETHLGAEESALRQDLIRKFISQAKSKDRITEYETFLMQYFDFVRDTLLIHHMDKTDDQKSLFMYHFGPVYFLKVVMHFMREGRTGFIHRHIKKDQMLRELPFQYVKYTLKDWWEDRVYQHTTKNDRNSWILYEEIINYIKNMWREQQGGILLQIKNDPQLFRLFNIHDIKSLAKFLETELSYLMYITYFRFLGPDFLYLPVHHGLRLKRRE